MEVDYIIVGGGIAGCSLAMELLNHGRSILMVDYREENSSSQVAAGLLNPIVPRRVTLAWNGKHIFHKVRTYYEHMEKQLNTDFFYAMPLVQVHASEDEAQLWRRRCNDEQIAEFVIPQSEKNHAGISTPFGYCEIRFSGRLDAQKFCSAVHSLLKSSSHLLAEKFNFDALQMDSSRAPFVYGEFAAQGLVFCEGTAVKQNPFFSWLPIKSSWGDIIQIKTSESVNDKIMYKQKHWTIPLQQGTWLCGSNFLNDEGDKESERETSELIFQQVQTWFPAKEMLSYKRAARPVVQDRRPVMGAHPTKKGMFIFNGLGTKGCSLVSWLAPVMTDYILHKKPLPEEVILDRFLV